MYPEHVALAIGDTEAALSLGWTIALTAVGLVIAFFVFMIWSARKLTERGLRELEASREHQRLIAESPDLYPEMAPAARVPRRYRGRDARTARTQLESLGFESIGFVSNRTPAFEIVTEQFRRPSDDVFAGLMVRGDWIAFTGTSVYFSSRFGGERVLFTSAGDAEQTEHSEGRLVRHGKSGPLRPRLRAHGELLERLREAHGPPTSATTLDDRIQMMRDTERWYWKDEGEELRAKRLRGMRDKEREIREPWEDAAGPMDRR